MNLVIGETSRCRVVTPEGMPLTFDVATLGDRLAAFLLDIAVIAGGTLALFFLAALAWGAGGGEVAVAFALLAGFLLRQFYFAFFELRGSGTTPGKRRLGLRVVSRDGGPLTAEMILARNLMRDLELFLPLVALLAPEALFPQGRGLGVLAGMAWLLVFALMPLFGSYRLRCGDLLAGTVVIREPKAPLLPDLAMEGQAAGAAEGDDDAEHRFPPEQLEIYGIHELQVLEDLFRRRREGRAPRELLEAVADRIQRKIGWTPPPGGEEPMRFLRAFYKAQRAHLERKLLLGERKERKSAAP